MGNFEVRENWKEERQVLGTVVLVCIFNIASCVLRDLQKDWIFFFEV